MTTLMKTVCTLAAITAITGMAVGASLHVATVHHHGTADVLLMASVAFAWWFMGMAVIWKMCRG